MILARDVAGGVDFMESRWGSAGKWWDRWSEFVDDFEEFDAAEFRRVLDDWYRSGEKFPPRPGQVLAKLRVGGVRQEFTADSCSHPEPWGFVVLEDHDRECFCRLCGYTWVVPPSGVATELELEGRPRRGNVA